MSPKIGKVMVALGVPATGLGAYILWYSAGRSYYDSAAAMQACAIGGAGSIMLGVGLGKLVKPIVGALVVVAFAGVAAFLIHGKMVQDSADNASYAARQAVADALWPACAGTPVPAAAAYVPSALSPTIVFNKSSDGGHYAWGNDAEAQRWAPPSVAQAQLVGCVLVDKQLVDLCTYSVGADRRSVERIKYAMNVVVHEARTGKVVAEHKLEGSEPSPCPESKSFSLSGGGNDSISGSYPSNDEVLAVIRPLVGTAERAP